MIHILRMYIILQSGDCKNMHQFTPNSAGRYICICKFSVLHILTFSNQGGSGSDIDDSQPAIEILRKLQDGSNGEVTCNIAGLILSYLKNGINSFSATDIARDLGLSRKSVNNFIRKFAEKGIIYMSRKIGNLKYFSVSSNDLETDIYSDHLLFLRRRPDWYC